MAELTERNTEILKCFDGADKGVCVLIGRLVDEMVDMENELTRLKSFPWLVVHPSNKSKQMQTPASKLYATLISRYTDIVNKLATLLRRAETEEESPLRQYLKGLNKSD